MSSKVERTTFDTLWNRKCEQGEIPIHYVPGENLRLDRAIEIVAPGRQLLDIGCGSGLFCAQIAHHCDSVFGLEIAHAPLQAARALGVLSVQADVSEYGLPFNDTSFDTVTLLSVLQYLSDPAAALAESRRVLRPGGRVLLSVPNMRTVGKIWRLVFRGVFPTTSQDTVGYDGGTIHYFCVSDVDRLLKAAGFGPIDHYGIYCRPSFVGHVPDRSSLAHPKHEFFSGEVMFVATRL